MHYFVYCMKILLKEEADLIPFSKTERVAIDSWRSIERVTCQQLIGYLKHT